MLWGIANTYLISPMAGTVLPEIVIGAHAHFGMLSILAVVTGFAIERTSLADQWRSVAIWSFVAGQWLLPATILMEMVLPPLLLTAYLWGILLTVSMALVAWGTIQEVEGEGGEPQATPAD
jgi:hypothetical protein